MLTVVASRKVKEGVKDFEYKGKRYVFNPESVICLKGLFKRRLVTFVDYDTGVSYVFKNPNVEGIAPAELDALISEKTMTNMIRATQKPKVDWVMLIAGICIGIGVGVVIAFAATLNQLTPIIEALKKLIPTTPPPVKGA
ncbi:MAG: hypothetical protein QXR81_08130 [Candidatus Nezhaarchaeales archaeon]